MVETESEEMELQTRSYLARLQEKTQQTKDDFSELIAVSSNRSWAVK